MDGWPHPLSHLTAGTQSATVRRNANDHGDNPG
jgi:hypothetical protein